MLFLSRRISKNEYGVVDTDDGVESRVSFSELCRIIQMPGITIGGVETVSSDWLVDNALLIRPYQPKETITSLQAKTSALYGVDITIYKDMVTSIQIRADVIKYPVELRLSDFGTYISMHVFRGVNRRNSHHVLTLKLDDSLRLHTEAFSLGSSDNAQVVGIHGLGVVFDLTEVSKTYIVNNVYETLFRQIPGLVYSSIIDDEERMSKVYKRLWS